MPVPFITVEGPIGVGKTSLTKAIADRNQFQMLKEIVDENPFLNKFYEDIEEWSFQTEMFFLCNRYKQMADIQKKFISKRESVVADYHIFKNLIFAKRTLAETEYAKYESIYTILTEDMPKPNMVVYLHASLDTLMARIKMRGREFEQMITPEYMEQLAADYHEYMERFEREHPEIPVLRVNGDEMDFVHNDDDLALILSKVDDILQKRSLSV